MVQYRIPRDPFASLTSPDPLVGGTEILANGLFQRPIDKAQGEERRAEKEQARAVQDREFGYRQQHDETEAAGRDARELQRQSERAQDLDRLDKVQAEGERHNRAGENQRMLEDLGSAVKFFLGKGGAAKPSTHNPQTGDVAPSHIINALTMQRVPVQKTDAYGAPFTVYEEAPHPQARENLKKAGIDPDTLRYIDMAAQPAPVDQAPLNRARSMHSRQVQLDNGQAFDAQHPQPQDPFGAPSADPMSQRRGAFLQLTGGEHGTAPADDHLLEALLSDDPGVVQQALNTAYAGRPTERKQALDALAQIHGLAGQPQAQ